MNTESSFVCEGIFSHQNLNASHVQKYVGNSRFRVILPISLFSRLFIAINTVERSQTAFRPATHRYHSSSLMVSAIIPQLANNRNLVSLQNILLPFPRLQQRPQRGIIEAGDKHRMFLAFVWRTGKSICQLACQIAFLLCTHILPIFVTVLILLILVPQILDRSNTIEGENSSWLCFVSFSAQIVETLTVCLGSNHHFALYWRLHGVTYGVPDG